MKKADIVYKGGKIQLIHREDGIIEEHEIYAEDAIDFITEIGFIRDFTVYLQEVKKRFGEDIGIVSYAVVSNGRLTSVDLGPSMVYKNVKCVYLDGYELDKYATDLDKIKTLKSSALHTLTKRKHNKKLVQYRFVGKNIGKLVKEFAEFVYRNLDSEIIEELKKVNVDLGFPSGKSIRISEIYSLGKSVVFEITLTFNDSDENEKVNGDFKSLIVVGLDIGYDNDMFVDYFTDYLTKEFDPFIALMFIGNIPYLMGYIQGLSAKLGLEIPKFNVFDDEKR